MKSYENFPPVLAPGTQTVPYNQTLTLSKENGNQLAIDTAGLTDTPLQLSIDVTNGTVSLSQIRNLTFFLGKGNDDNHLVFKGSPFSINEALNGLIFTPTPQFKGTASIVLKTDTGSSKELTIKVLEKAFIEPISVDKETGQFTFKPTRAGQEAFSFHTNHRTFISVTAIVSKEPGLLVKAPTLTKSPEKGNVTLNKDGSITYKSTSTKPDIDYIHYSFPEDNNTFHIKLIVQTVPYKEPKSQPIGTPNTPGKAQILVKREKKRTKQEPAYLSSFHEAPPAPKNEETLQEEAVTTAATVAAFAIGSETYDLDDETNSKEEKKGFLTDVIKSLFK